MNDLSYLRSEYAREKSTESYRVEEKEGRKKMSREIAEQSINQGTEFPFDASDKWWNDSKDHYPPPAKDWAHVAARGILADLTDRRDIKRGFEGVDEDVRVEIVESLAEIIRVTKETK
jgi:hypothetical protein